MGLCDRGSATLVMFLAGVASKSEETRDLPSSGNAKCSVEISLWR